MTGSSGIAPAHPSGAGLFPYPTRRFVLPALSMAAAGAAIVVLATQTNDEMLDYGVQVFQQVLVTPELTLRPIVTVLVVAAAGLVLAGVLSVAKRRNPDG
jgi:hypothetical protein